MKHLLRLRSAARCGRWLLLLAAGLTLRPAQAQTTPPAFATAWATGTVASPFHGTSAISATARDAAGNVYVAGTFTGTIGFGSLSLGTTEPFAPYNTADAFVGKLDAGGNWLWVRNVGSLAPDEINTLATDASGNAYVTGSFGNNAPGSTSITFGSTTLTAPTPGTDNKFVAKLDAGGTWLWARSLGTRPSSLALDASGNAYLAGAFNTPTATFGTTTLSNAGTGTFGTTTFLAKLTAAGQWSWAQQVTGTGANSALAVSTDGSHAYLTGRFLNTATFGSTTLTATGGGTNAFVAKCDAQGAWLWARRTDVVTTGIVADATGNTYLSGWFSALVTVGGTTLAAGPTGYTGYAAFVGKLDAAGNWLWARASSGSGALGNNATAANSLALDGSGNVYLAGGLGSATTSFGSTTLLNSGPSSYPMSDAFVAKLDVQGNWLWARQTSSPDTEIGTYVGADAAGNVWLTVDYDGEVVGFGNNFVTRYLSGPGQRGTFLSKLDAQGNWLWARTPDHGGSSSSCRHALPDAAGNVYAAGSFTGVVRFGNTSFTSHGYTDGFVAKLDAQGNYLWTTLIGSAGPDDAYHLAYDASGNVYVTGFFSGSISLGNTVLTAAVPNEAFVAKLDAQGNWLWARRTGAQPSIYTPSFGNSLALDASGNVYLAGYFSGTGTFGSTTLTATSTFAPDLFIAKLDAQGNWLWARQAAGAGGDYARALALDAAGNAYLAGSFASPTLGFGPTTLTNASTSDEDSFVAKISPTGTWLWAKNLGNAGRDELQALAVDASGNLYVAGNFNAPTFTIGSTTLTNTTANGSFDLYVARLDASGTPLWARAAGGPGYYDTATNLVLAPNGTPCLTGVTNGTATFGATTLTSTSSSSTFVAQLDAQGTWLWAVPVGAAQGSYAPRLSTDASGNLYLGGHFQGPGASFGSLTLSTAATGALRGYVARIPAIVTAQRPATRPAALQLYPNPTAGRRVQLLATELAGPTAELRVLNGLGQVVRHETLPLTARRLDYQLELPTLPAGAYTVQLRTATGLHTGQLLLQ